MDGMGLCVVFQLRRLRALVGSVGEFAKPGLHGMRLEFCAISAAFPRISACSRLPYHSASFVDSARCALASCFSQRV